MWKLTETLCVVLVAAGVAQANVARQGDPTVSAQLLEDFEAHGALRVWSLPELSCEQSTITGRTMPSPRTRSAAASMDAGS